jgi:acetyl-CoA C-acetyltransferase
MREAVILAACRTAIGKFQGTMAPLSEGELGACVVRKVVRRAGIAPEKVDEVIMGNVVSAGLGQNPAPSRPCGAAASRSKSCPSRCHEGKARRSVKRGIAALCLGGANAVALAVERY